MKRIAWLVGATAIFLNLGSTWGRESEGVRRDSVLLNGPWEFALGEGSEGAETAAGQAKLPWKRVTLPGPFMPWNQEVANQTKVAWARRSFTVTRNQAAGLAVLRWNRVANGAEAFVNGRKVGDNEPTGPYQVIVPAGVLQPGENQIVLKIRGAAGVRKSRSGNALIPAGFGVGMPEVTDDVWIDFADTAYMKWVLALPDLAGSRVRIRVTPTGLERAEGLTIVARVQSGPNGQIVGEGRASARLVPDPDPLGGEHFFVDVPMTDFQPWTHEKCPLYYARVKLVQGDRVLDDLTFRFGMREIGIKDRHYQLNGRRLWLRGSNLVFEWDWGDTITGHELDYLVTEAREMSMNCFRTHTRPLPRLWADIGDEHGTMILAEFPVLFNYQDYKFTPEEWAVWHRNCLLDAAGWMARLWNHPSVIMWVLSNESRGDNAWEEGPFQDFVNALDPTRPTMRTGSTGTKENYDVHPCGNVTDTEEGNLQPAIAGWFKDAGPRTTTASEYMNDFGHPRTQWTGVDDRLANDLAVAQIGAEHTEAMRRARVDAILPYMYAGWTRTRLAARVRETGKGSAIWKANYAAPQSAAWHSALSPVLASLDLFDPDYRAGQEVTTDLHLINDSWHDANVHVDLLLTRENPEFIPEAACFDQPVSKWAFDFVLQADSIRKVPVTWKLPDVEGSFWLTARMTGEPGRPVLSQRFVRAIRPSTISDASQQRTFVVLGNSDAARAFFKSKGLRTSDRIDQLSPDHHVVVIWNATHLTDEEKRGARTLCEFAARGGRVIVLSTPSWNWPELCDVKIGKAQRFSRVFPYEPAARSVLRSFNPEWLIRWNGFPGAVGLAPFEGPAMAHAEKILWAKEPKTTVAALLPAAEGSGRILFLQLDLQRRLDASRPYFDPAAERLLLSFLAAGKQVTIVHYPDQGHGFSLGLLSPEAALKFFQDCNAFVRPYLATQLAWALVWPAQALAAKWTPLRSLSGLDSIGSPGGTHPFVADGDTVHAVWCQGGAIQYRRSDDAGKTWTHAVPLTTSGKAQYPCSLELAGTILHLIWTDSRNPGWELYYMRSTNGGKTWGKEVRLTPGIDMFRFGTAVSGTNVHIVWGSRSRLDKVPVGQSSWTWTWGDIDYLHSYDAGATWEKPIRLSQKPGTAMRPAVAASGRFVHITWFDQCAAKQNPAWDWDIYYRRSTDGGATWEPELRMTDTPMHTRHPQIVATTSNRVCCIWEDGQIFDGHGMVGDPALYAAVSTNNGATWGKSRRITAINAPNGFATHAKAYGYGSRVHLTWQDAPEGPQHPRAIYYMTSADGGLTWETPERLTQQSAEVWETGAVVGTESWALVEMMKGPSLWYRRRDLLSDP